MGRRRELHLSTQQREALVRISRRAVKPFHRERATALLKVADGMPAWLVARKGLLRARDPDTIYDWLNRYRDQGLEGLLTIRPGRGRKPAFSPSPSGQGLG